MYNFLLKKITRCNSNCNKNDTSDVCQKDLVAIDSPLNLKFVLPLPDRNDEKKASKRWQDCPMRDLAPTRCPAHLCLPVFLSLSHLSLLLFPFSLSRPQTRRSTYVFSILSVSAPRYIRSSLHDAKEPYMRTSAL